MLRLKVEGCSAGEMNALLVVVVVVVAVVDVLGKGALFMPWRKN